MRPCTAQEQRFRGAPAEGFAFNYVIRQQDANVQLHINLGADQREAIRKAFGDLYAQRGEIETAFGASLEWERLEAARCRIRYDVIGGYRSSVDTWPDIQEQMIDAMRRLDRTTRERIVRLSLYAHWRRAGRT